MAKLVSAGTNAFRAAKPHVQHFWYYAKVELAPPKLSEIPAIPGAVAKLVSSMKAGRWKNTTVKDAVINSLVTAEVLCWFFIGECIGKRHLIGYDLH